MDIKPIETVYNGYRFRSRLEARWAVFFDSLNVDYEYEPEGFDLGDGQRYLPDFKVQCHGTRGDCSDSSFPLWIEIKGVMTKRDAERIIKFSGYDMYEKHGDYFESWPTIENPVLVLDRIPNPYEYPCDCFYSRSDWNDIDPFNYMLIDGDWFGAYPAADQFGRFYLWGADGNYINNSDVKRVQEALKTARQARFEHGETPVVYRR